MTTSKERKAAWMLSAMNPSEDTPSRSRLLALLGGLACAAVLLLAGPAPAAKAEPLLDGLDWQVLDQNEEPSSQAGGHPGEMSMRVQFDSSVDEPKTLRFRLPRGLVGDPTAIPRCSRAQFATADALACPDASQVGTVHVVADFVDDEFGLYNLVPAPGAAATFGMSEENLPVISNATVTPEGGYAVQVNTPNILQTVVLHQLEITIWGAPVDSIHDGKRGRCLLLGGTCPVDVPVEPFLTNPTDCSAGRRLASAAVEGWRNRGVFEKETADAYPEGLTGCERLAFEPDISVQPTSQQANSPTGLHVELEVPQGEPDPGGLATSHLKGAEVTLPEGMAVNPASANGLKACSPEEIGLVGKDPVELNDEVPTCPEASKIGRLRVETPVLEEAIPGSIYVAEQGDNAFDSLLSIYLVAHSPERGVLVKLPGKVSPDPETGQLKTTFDDNPQLPFEKFTLRFKGGPRAPLVNPSDCGSHAASWEFTPWSGTAPVSGKSSFEIDRGCGEGGFDPSFAAGTASPIAGAHAPFLMRLSRGASEPEVRSVSLNLPEGLSAKLAGIRYCSEAALASFGDEGITEPGTATSEIADPACPAESLIGEVMVGAGAGPNPFYLDTGRAYLAGPYRGAPLSVAIVTAAKAGPFDLGSILVRSALYVDDRTAEITVRSDEIPAILEGIPLNLRDIRVNVDREGFSLNPTSCEAMEIGARINSHSGPAASLSHPFQVTNCAALDFEPRFGMRILNPGRRSTLRSFNPAMRFTVVPRPGDANLGPAQVVLPSSVILDQSNIRTICTREQFADRRCPDASVYGFARAWSPLLDEPLIGPVFLGSSPNPLPDIIADLRGQVDVTLQGQIDSVRAARAGRSGESRGARMRNTFRVVPDVPVSRFQLTMFGGANRGVLVNSRDLCTSTEGGVALFKGQNGKLSLQRPAIRTAFRGCRKVRRLEVRRTIRRRAVIRKALRSGSLSPSQARRQIRS